MTHLPPGTRTPAELRTPLPGFPLAADLLNKARRAEFRARSAGAPSREDATCFCPRPALMTLSDLRSPASGF